MLLLQMEEVKSLRRQLIAATNEIMEIRRWTLLIFIPYIHASRGVEQPRNLGIG
jgi:hypothetical protein